LRPLDRAILKGDFSGQEKSKKEPQLDLADLMAVNRGMKPQEKVAPTPMINGFKLL